MRASSLHTLLSYLRQYHLKPAPDVWIETARRAKVNPGNQLVFEDSPHRIQGAVEVGAYCIGMPVSNYEHSIFILVKAGAQKIFKSWTEVDDACQLIKDVNRERLNL